MELFLRSLKGRKNRRKSPDSKSFLLKGMGIRLHDLVPASVIQLQLLLSVALLWASSHLLITLCTLLCVTAAPQSFPMFWLGYVCDHSIVCPRLAISSRLECTRAVVLPNMSNHLSQSFLMSWVAEKYKSDTRFWCSKRGRLWKGYSRIWIRSADALWFYRLRKKELFLDISLASSTNTTRLQARVWQTTSQS